VIVGVGVGVILSDNKSRGGSGRVEWRGGRRRRGSNSRVSRRGRVGRRRRGGDSKIGRRGRVGRSRVCKV